jgi:signal transduction histidine kinase
VELSELARAVAAELELQATERQVRIDVHATPGPVWVAADPGAVARIVRILLDNALRVAPTGSAIDVDVRGSVGLGADRQDGAAELSAAPTRSGILVRDRGPGVPSAERELIFERFRRGAGAVGQGGFGLGLAIGRELASRMGGKLELLRGLPSAARAGGGSATVSEPGPNGAGDGAYSDRHGACFALWLPAAKMHDVPLSAVSGTSAGAVPQALAHTRG